MEQPKQSKRTLSENLSSAIFLVPFLVGLVISTTFGCLFGAVLWIVFTCVGTDRLIVNIGMRSIIFLILMAILFPIFGNARTNARGRTCLSHVKQLTQSTLLYAQDYDSNLPMPIIAPSAPFPYLQDRSLLVCPEDRNRTGSYAFNNNLKNVGLNAMAWPEKTLLIYEGQANILQYRHNNHATLGFADGHCKLVAPADVSALFWTPQAPPNLPAPALDSPPKRRNKAGTDSESGGPVYMR